VVDAGNHVRPGQRRYLVTLHGRVFVVVIGEGPKGLSVTVDDEPVALDVVLQSGPALAARIDGHIVRTLARVRDEDVDVVLAGEALLARVEDHRRQLLQRVARDGRAGPKGEVVRAPMPGLVVSVPVSVGDTVAKGTSVVVLQAMKMENELRASTSGRVVEVRVDRGQAVEQGQVLLVLE
jgi:biotin carboxyl carrier protein